MKKDMERAETKLTTEYNALCDKVHAMSNRSGLEILQSLTDAEMFTFIAGKTLKYGRSVDDSIKNAQCHMGNRAKAERSFSLGSNDLLGMVA